MTNLLQFEYGPSETGVLSWPWLCNQFSVVLRQSSCPVVLAVTPWAIKGSDWTDLIFDDYDFSLISPCSSCLKPSDVLVQCCHVKEELFV